jgi:RNase P protein component
MRILHLVGRTIRRRVRPWFSFSGARIVNHTAVICTRSCFATVDVWALGVLLYMYGTHSLAICASLVA